MSLKLNEIQVRRVERGEEASFQGLMRAHHYLGCLPKIGETIWYVATWNGEWLALASFSAAAWKCAVRDQWIGWGYRHQYDRLNLAANNSRFLILPSWHRPNLGSKVLSLCERRIARDWQESFGHPLLLLETFVDPERFQGTVYKAANWLYLGLTRGFRRTREGYNGDAKSPKKVFVKPLRPDARSVLSGPFLDSAYQTGEPRIMLSAEQMRSLPGFFTDIPDPRRSQGRRHGLRVVLGIAAGAQLCGMKGYSAISDWAKKLGQKARERFGCRRVNGRYIVPSEYIIRDVLIRVDPQDLDRALQRWNEVHAVADTSLALDGKTMCNAIDGEDRQVQVMSVIGHESKICYTQKKWGLCQ